MYNFFSLIITFTLITLFFKMRFGRNCLDIPLNITNMGPYFGYFLIVFLFSVGIILYLLILYNINPNKFGFFSSFKRIFNVVSKYNVFFNAYTLIFDFLSPDYTVYLVNFAKKFVEFSEKKIKLLVYVFVVLPRILVILILVLEVYVFKTLHYYFYSLLLLLIPLLFKLFIFIFKDLSTRLVPLFTGFFDTQVNDVPNNIRSTGLGIGFKLKPEWSHLDIDDILHNLYLPVLYLHGHMRVSVVPLYDKISKYSIFIYYILQALIWGYILVCYF